jgi:hypothetical protein
LPNASRSGCIEALRISRCMFLPSVKVGRSSS